MEHTNAKPTTERNYGIDLLRILSMFMVVVLHILGQGGALAGNAVRRGGVYAQVCALKTLIRETSNRALFYLHGGYGV